MKTLILVGGPMGVGKTSVCQALKSALSDAVFLDGDWCWNADPFHVTDETKAMVIDNICYLLNNFLHCSAYEHVIFAWVLHEQALIDGLLARLDTAGYHIRALSLIADAAALRSRLEADIAAGHRSADVVPRSLAYLPLYDTLTTTKIDTTGKRIDEIVRTITAF